MHAGAPPPPGSRGPALTVPARHQPAAALRDLIRSGEARRLRQGAGISPETTAAGLGVHPHTFALLERGARPPGPALAARYLRVLQGLANHDQVSRDLAREQEAA